MFKVDLQTLFGDDFYTIPIQKALPRPPEPSELPENPKIHEMPPKYFQQIVKIDRRLKNLTLGS